MTTHTYHYAEPIEGYEPTDAELLAIALREAIELGHAIAVQYAREDYE